MYIFIYVFIFLFIGFFRSTVQSMIVNGVIIYCYTWNATCSLCEVVKSPSCNQLLFTAYCHE